MKKIFAGIILVSSFFTAQQTKAQDDNNPISTAVPFLTISPDSKSGAMGDAGVATSPDVYSQNWNSSKYAFIESNAGFSISYTPWLKKLVDDMNLAYLSGYYRLDKNQTIGAGLRYFSMGAIDFTDNNGDKWASYNPNEFAFDLSYNRKLGEHFALGLAPRFIYSNLTGGNTNSSEATKPGKSVAVDINGFYKNDFDLNDYDANWNFGFAITNLGSKLSYTDNEDEKNFIPTKLALGGSVGVEIDKYNSIMATLELGKLLVPTPPIYYEEGDTLSDGVTVYTGDPEDLIKEGKDPNVGPIQGVFQSFSDAPGGFKEEMQEIMYSVGIEYSYAEQFMIRAGYFNENENKGNRKYVTVGAGLRMNVFGLDFSYLIPVAGTYNGSPLEGTWRFSLIFDLKELK